jgi:hypothetical protein
MNMESAFCTEKQLLSDEFQMWARFYGHSGSLHRKYWEWCFISQALKEHDVLRPGKHGLGFGVGGEPLVSGFASFGASITATDLEYEEAVKKGWVETGQHWQSKTALNAIGLCSAANFDNLVYFDFCDMNHIPTKYYNKYEFVWSSCALDHLGSMEKGAEFIYNSLRCLKNGGIAVHTTEFNVSSNTETWSSDDLYIFRKCDIETIICECRRQGYNININWDFGTSFADYHVDLPPYKGNIHLKLKIADYTVTSIGLIVTKP